jgi:hypothetical protein
MEDRQRQRARAKEPPDRDDFGLNQSKLMNVIGSKSLELDAGGKPVSTIPHPALGLTRMRGGMTSVEVLTRNFPHDSQ